MMELEFEKNISELPTRFALVKFSCPYCAKCIKAINFVNRYLPDDKRIKILDNIDWELYKFKSNQIMDNFDEEVFNGYPLISIDSIDVQPAEPELLIISIAKIVEDDLIMPINMENVTIGKSIL